VKHIIERLDERKTPIKYLLLDFQAVGFIDITGIDELRVLNDEVKRRGVRLALMGVHLPVKEVLQSSGFIQELGFDHLIETKGQAITLLFERINHSYCSDVCPYKLFFECATVK
jgi:SulP family sulfate permease